jgi:RNase P/RNase MRP subunit p29
LESPNILATERVETPLVSATERVETPLVEAETLVSTAPTGTTPLILTSTTKVNNLNADMLDGFHASIFATADTLNTHISATTGIHGATSAATANALVIRDESGRAKVAAPSAADDIARKDTVDAVQTNLTNHANATTGIHGATSAANANTIVIRDASGRAKVASPSAADDIARKDYVDNRIVYHTYSGSATFAALNVGQFAVTVWTFSGSSTLTFPSTGTYVIMRNCKGYTNVDVTRSTIDGGSISYSSSSSSLSPIVLYVLRIS